MSNPPPPCDCDIFRNSTLVMVTHTIRAQRLEEWVQSVAALSGQKVDWHYAGGRACILALGNLERVRWAIAQYLPEHDRLQKEDADAILPGRPYEPNCTLYGEGEINPVHEIARNLNNRETPAP